MGPAAAIISKSSIPGVADQPLFGPEDQHQEDTDDAKDGPGRLVEDELAGAVPEPGDARLEHGLQRLLACLVDVVPELAEAGQAYCLIGNRALTVIDKEYEACGEQQQPDKAKQTTDHASHLEKTAPLNRK